MFFFAIPKLPEFVKGELPADIVSRDVFTREELDRITILALKLESRKGTVGFENRVDPEYNRSDFRQLYPTPEFQWIFERLARITSIVNASAFNFEISGFDQPLYHITYRAEEKGFYDWHSDLGGRDCPTRKLSVTVQLSEPSDYEGGELMLNPTGKPQPAPKDRGAVIVFPSYTVHRVAPVTRGTRLALVTWVVGPPFR